MMQKSRPFLDKKDELYFIFPKMQPFVLRIISPEKREDKIIVEGDINPMRYFVFEIHPSNSYQNLQKFSPTTISK